MTKMFALFQPRKTIEYLIINCDAILINKDLIMKCKTSSQLDLFNPVSVRVNGTEMDGSIILVSGNFTMIW